MPRQTNTSTISRAVPTDAPRIGRTVRACALAAAAAVLSGCQSYRPEPLTAERVEHALVPPDEDTLRIEASALRHPLLPTLSFDSRDGLSPDEAAVTAVLLHPTLKAARDARAVADAQLLQAGLLPNPQVTAGVEPVTGGATEGTVPGYSLEASWDLNALVTRRAEHDRAMADRNAVELDVAWQEWQVAQAARLAVYAALGLREQVAIAREMTNQTAEALAVLNRAVSAGLATETDKADAEAAYNQARSDLADLQRQLDEQEVALHAAVGLPLEIPLPLQQGLCLPSHVAIPPLSELLPGLEQRRLDLVALRRGYESQEATVRAAILAQFPAVSISMAHVRDTGNVISLPMGICIELPVFDRHQAAIARELATRRKLNDEYVNRVFEARAELATLVAGAEGIKRQLRVAEAALPALQRRATAYRQAVEQGQADVMSRNTATRDFAAKRLETVALRQQLMGTRIAIGIAAGIYELKAAEPTPASIPSRAHKGTP